MTAIVLRFAKTHEDLDEMHELVIDYLFDQGFDVIIAPNEDDFDRHEYDDDVAEHPDLESLMNLAWDHALLNRRA